MKLYAAASVVFLPLTLLGATVLPASPGEPAPLQPADLLREADRSSSLVAEILRGLAIPSDGYEQKVLDGVQRLLKVEDAREGTWAAEKALRAGLRYSLSHQQPGSDNPWAVQLSDRLLQVRRQLLKLLEQDTDDKVALAWADIWLPLYGSDSSIGDDVRGLWARHAEHRLKAGELEAARRWLDRIEENFANSPQADPVRKQLRDRAEALRQQARDVPDGKAVVLLNQALSLWPRLPELRDDLERRRQTYQVLYVAVRDLPEFLSPALAFSDAERQLVELIFEGLVQARHEVKRGPSYRPVLADRLIEGAGPRRPIVLRRDVFWPSGDRFTAADVRHTVGLLKKSRDAAWRDLLEPPRLESNPFALGIVYAQGLLDPWAPLCFKLLPQNSRGKPLASADDPEFAKEPEGTGPYQYGRKEGADGRVYLVLKANPQYVRRGSLSPGSIREIRFFARKDGDEEPDRPLPHLVLDALPAEIAALKKKGLNDIRSLPVPRVWFLGVNHRRVPFANANVRLALAQAVDRQGLLDRHFRADPSGSGSLTVNGLFPRGSWAVSPVQRVPEELYRPEDARASARKAASELTKVEWTLKYPDGDPRLHAALKELAEHAGKVLGGPDVHVVIRPMPLPPRKLQEAIRERDFDLVYHHLDMPDTPGALWPLFDPSADALQPGGSNFLGFEDAPLQSLLRSALHHRNFPQVREFMQDIHARLHATMPLIPLWQLPYVVVVHSQLRTPDLDPLAVFGNVLEWKLTP
jgi:ABC-type transport system substrate-binding protein